MTDAFKRPLGKINKCVKLQSLCMHRITFWFMKHMTWTAGDAAPIVRPFVHFGVNTFFQIAGIRILDYTVSYFNPEVHNTNLHLRLNLAP